MQILSLSNKFFQDSKQYNYDELSMSRKFQLNHHHHHHELHHYSSQYVPERNRLFQN